MSIQQCEVLVGNYQLTGDESCYFTDSFLSASAIVKLKKELTMYDIACLITTTSAQMKALQKRCRELMKSIDSIYGIKEIANTDAKSIRRGNRNFIRLLGLN